MNFRWPAFCGVLATIGLATLAAGQSPPQWQYIRDDDPLQGGTHHRFELQGEFLKPPRLSSQDAPVLVVVCAGGKLEKDYLNVTAVVAQSRCLDDQCYIVVPSRIDGKKGELLGKSSTDGQAVMFPAGSHFLGTSIKDVLAGHTVILGVNEAFGAQIVMQFEIPDPSPIYRACEKSHLEKSGK